jgi:pyrrolidone-carboxylate peptidase
LIILTGFGPFDEYKVNLSSEIVNHLPFEFSGIQVIKAIIPVSWRESIKTYKQLFYKLKLNPELVILLGIHTKNKIHLEVYGWNFKVGNDEEKKFKFGPIKLYSPPWIKTILNVNKIYADLEDMTNISISYFPGLYLCNYLYYWALILSQKEYPVIFIHIPCKGNISEYVQKIEMIIQSMIGIHLKGDLNI